jgi:hypothetical protein
MNTRTTKTLAGLMNMKRCKRSQLIYGTPWRNHNYLNQLRIVCPQYSQAWIKIWNWWIQCAASLECVAVSGDDRSDPVKMITYVCVDSWKLRFSTVASKWRHSDLSPLLIWLANQGTAAVPLQIFVGINVQYKDFVRLVTNWTSFGWFDICSVNSPKTNCERPES